MTTRSLLTRLKKWISKWHRDLPVRSTPTSGSQNRHSTRPKKATATFTTAKGVVSEDTITPYHPEVATCPVDSIDIFGSKQYQPLGHCMYCGTTDNLTNEHIVPFGLSGSVVLPKSSCEDCAKVTGTFEGQVLRGPMRSVRMLRDLKSRSKHSGSPTSYPIKVRRNNVIETIELPLAQYPILLHFPTFVSVREKNETREKGITLTGLASISFGQSPEAAIRALDAQEIFWDGATDHPVSFARMIGKIGYAMAVAEGLIDTTDNRPPIVASLLGQEDRIGQWVSNQHNDFRKYPGVLHRLRTHKDPATNSIVVEVQLFSDSDTPTYLVTF